MSLRNLILLISIVGFSTTLSLIIRPQRLLIVHLLPESMRNLGDMSDRWKRMHPEPKAPQVEINLMKDYVSSEEKWAFSNECKYSDKDYDVAAKITPTTDETKVSRIENDDINKIEKKKENSEGVKEVQDVVTPKEFIPQPRNIIKAPPASCPHGQKKDGSGNCRDILYHN